MTIPVTRHCGDKPCTSEQSCGWCFDRGGCVSPQSCELPIDPPTPARRWPTGILIGAALSAAGIVLFVALEVARNF